MKKQDKQPSRPSKASASDKLPPTDMNTLAKGGDKESNEPLRKGLKSRSPMSTSRKSK